MALLRQGRYEVNRAEMRVGSVERVLHGLLVGLVVRRDAPHHLLHGELARIDGRAGVEHPPDETDPELRLAAGHRGPGPGCIEQRGVDVQHRAVGVDVGARKACRDERCAVPRSAPVEFVDVAVLRIAQGLVRHSRPEVLGIARSAVRRIEHQWSHDALGGGAREGGMVVHVLSFRWHAERWPGAISRKPGASAAQRAMACGQRGWKWQPVGGLSGDGISPLMGT